MTGKVLVVGGDLMARARLQSAATAAGMELVTAPVASIERAMSEHRPDVVVLDLDEGRAEGLTALRAGTGASGAPRAVAYYSHVDEELGRAAEAAGVTALPRGRFWRELPELLRPPG